MKKKYDRLMLVLGIMVFTIVNIMLFVLTSMIFVNDITMTKYELFIYSFRKYPVLWILEFFYFLTIFSGFFGNNGDEE